MKDICGKLVRQPSVQTRAQRISYQIKQEGDEDDSQDPFAGGSIYWWCHVRDLLWKLAFDIRELGRCALVYRARLI